MGNTFAAIGPSEEASTSQKGGSAVTGTRAESGQGTSIAEHSSSQMGGSAVTGTRAECSQGTSIAEQITRSERHWSERVESDCSNEEEVADNREVFESLQWHPVWGDFFKTFGYDTPGWVRSGELSMGEKFAEGGQAELFLAHVTWRRVEYNDEMLKAGHKYALKVFKKGTSLRQLQSQWPQGFLKYRAVVVERSRLKIPQELRTICDVWCGTLLKDGRFAFLMARETEDLRSIIERSMLSSGEGQGPFTKGTAEWIMFRVAKGMDWLHRRDVVHRDLKAANVLFRQDDDGWRCSVADFECSGGVTGTGFFRAPEVLQAFRDRALSQRPEVFSKEADVYSYGMTCYEILTGRLPFEGVPVFKYDVVLKGGQRPEVPEYVEDWVRELVRRCWQEDPGARPAFGEIMNVLSANSAAVRQIELRDQQRKRELGIEDMLGVGRCSGGIQD